MSRSRVAGLAATALVLALVGVGGAEESAGVPFAAPEFIAKRCGAGCHAPPDPAMLSRDQWSVAIQLMKGVMKEVAGVEYSDQEMRRILLFYRSRSPERLAPLPADPRGSPVDLAPRPLGEPGASDPPPRIAHVELVDLDGRPGPEVLASDALTGELVWIRPTAAGWSESVLAKLTAPARAAVVDADGDGSREIVVAELGSLFPSNEKVGQVVLLAKVSDAAYSSRVILDGVGRVADVQPGDLDGDGDVDFAVAVFGHLQGGVGWLRRGEDGSYAFQWLYELPGAIHVPLADLDADGDLDIVALVAQAREEVIAFIGDGLGGFEARPLFEAKTPLFGSSGIDLADLDGDGDLDVLYTNGDSFDMVSARVPASALLRPHHGVRWLENRGGMVFAEHELLRLYGAFSARAGDLDGDGDLDVAVASLFNDWSDPGRQSLVWLENDGQQRFTPRGLGSSPSHIVSIALGDLDRDGRLDAVSGGMHVVPPFDRLGRVTWWRNEGGRSAGGDAESR